MSIELITGLPGNGKTLYTLTIVQERAEREGRPVYYHGIAELKLGWIVLEDPTKWFMCPPNSIVVIDEAQQIYRNRSIRAEAPLHVTELETHRHLGIDLYLLTQHPSLIDPAVRKLTQTHIHMVRIFGLKASTVHQWNGVKDNCDKARADSNSKKWVFNQKMFGQYKSAEVHTMKAAIPLRVKLLLLVPVLLALCAYAVYAILIKPRTTPAVAPVQAVAGAQLAAPGSASPGSEQVFDPMADARRFAHMNTPRLVGLAHTAPKYDELTKPETVPVPAMCIMGKSVCQCYSQQGTRLQMDMTMCIDIAHNGYFQEFDPDARKNKQGDDQVKAVGTLASSPASPQVSVVPYAPEPPRYR